MEIFLTLLCYICVFRFDWYFNCAFFFGFEGVVEQHLKAWFEDKSSGNYLGASLDEIDSKFVSLRPISEITPPKKHI